MLKRKQLSEKPNRCRKSKKVDDDDDDDDDEKINEELITSEDNHIYFYGNVNTKNVLILIKYIKTLNTKLLTVKNDIEIKYDSSIDLYIYLHINSPGGYITDAFAAIDYIKKSQIPIISIIDGFAASAATLMSVVCYKRQITEYSSILIHQLSGCLYGTFQQMKDDNENNNYLYNQMKKIYIENSNSKLTNKKLDTIFKTRFDVECQKKFR